MKENIERNIQEIIKTLFNIDEKVLLTPPPDKTMGDYATNISFKLAKNLHNSPINIATQISQRINDLEYILAVNVVNPGFINIKISDKYLLESIMVKDHENMFLDPKLLGNHISVEHTAANPNKHLHIGHLRNFIIGDSLVRILKAVGYNVSVQYIYNDQGLQIAKVIWGFLNLDKIGINIKEETKFDSYAAKVYVAAEKYLSEHNEYEEQVREIIKKMEEGENDISRFCEEATIKILLGQIQTIEKFAVYYDELVTETSMTQSNELKRVLDKLLKTGKVTKEIEGKNAGCIVIKGLKDENNNDLPDKVLIRADGTAVYTAKDIVLALWKFGLLDVSFNFIKLIDQFNGTSLYISIAKKDKGKTIKENALFHINVVDQRQSFAMDVVKESLRALGFKRESDNYFHLAYETVSLSLNTANFLGIETNEIEGKSIAMSGRKGIEVTIDELLEKVTQKIKEKNSDKEEKLTDKEAEKIAASALRYYMSKFAYNTIVVFDIDDALAVEGNSGIYLMYAYVRAKKILQKSNEFSKQFNIEQIQDIPESAKELILQLSYAKNTVNISATDFSINNISEYLYQTAKIFSNFYHDVPVIAEPDMNKREMYLNLIEYFIKVYSQMLELLGIYLPNHI